jgi:hypothetical protein
LVFFKKKENNPSQTTAVSSWKKTII